MPRVSANLSDEAFRGWDHTCSAARCTFTALVEAMGRLLLDGEPWTIEDATEAAAAIDRERRSR